MLVRWESPFSEFERLGDEMRFRARSPQVPMDAYRRGDAVYLHFDLPGIDPSTVDLMVDQTRSR
jgi:HSP20 family protein